VSTVQKLKINFCLVLFCEKERSHAGGEGFGGEVLLLQEKLGCAYGG